MPDWLELASSFASSPWLYLILISVSLLDSFLPLIPSEPVVIAAGVYAASGETELLWVVIATALGAFLGDLIPYGVGRALKDRILKRLPAGSKRRRTHDWLAAELARRGGFVLVSTRFIPVGRYIATLTTGIVGYSFWNYALFTGIAAVTWSTYTVLSGFIGGLLFQDNPVLGIGVGVGLGLVVTLAMEAVRHFRQKNRALDPS
ncbi:DedA protein [Actinoplanes sp. ATCC 53533]|uniref:DedA family protein n=1 Tax=Actinoplanes sp. ATCC 53533 TaxID=1288362 RepID=UPI000F79761B|nr:DedA family protein [Actinoplanes sp. ATCC 53533]RSM69609.1 DedA protein [Actinoplanes sp. ATCC 53533]